jgi:membrane protein implicated in regulation of membrane protease activity
LLKIISLTLFNLAQGFAGFFAIGWLVGMAAPWAEMPVFLIGSAFWAWLVIRYAAERAKGKNAL